MPTLCQWNTHPNASETHYHDTKIQYTMCPLYLSYVSYQVQKHHLPSHANNLLLSCSHIPYYYYRIDHYQPLSLSLEHKLALFSIVSYHLTIRKYKPIRDAATVHITSLTDNDAFVYVYAMGVIQKGLLLYNNLTSTLVDLIELVNSIAPASTEPHRRVITIFTSNNFKLA